MGEPGAVLYQRTVTFEYPGAVMAVSLAIDVWAKSVTQAQEDAREVLRELVKDDAKWQAVTVS